ncbi:pentatricopeptide repeat-containing protein At1g30610, chloroplastic isoform X2 [Actinidia eriantha]|uniref:pentatricopeptide repeat-containing protein At1g30610, chloroplastic isoform X2 n=1 Tax=Actinidia eriantha TaxID=165200 RepID=UPI00258559BB|nr:pentatricopeptide repeat-containing protein At1g30610, chloroplastic isoform X2 [Actinidia eriantha]
MAGATRLAWMLLPYIYGCGMISVANSDMGISLCERNGILAQNCFHKSSFSCGFPIPSRPILVVTLGTKKEKQACFFGLTTRSNTILKAKCTNRSVGRDFLEKEFEFKPSFDEYLKAMESVKISREKKQTPNSKRHGLDDAENRKIGDFEGHTQEGFEERGSREFKGLQKMGFAEKGNSGIARKWIRKSVAKESKSDANFNRKLDVDSKNGRWEEMKINIIQERQRNGELGGHSFRADKGSVRGTKMGVGLERNYRQGEGNTQEGYEERGSREFKGLKEMGFEETGNSGIARKWVCESEGKESKNAVNFNTKLVVDSKNGRWEKMRINIVQERQSYSELGGHSFRVDKGSIKGTTTGVGLERNERQVEAVPYEKIFVKNVKLRRSNTPVVETSYDEEVLERAAFKSLEGINDLVDKPRLSRNEMEERIQKLARSLNGADIDMPEWMFSKMVRSAKIRFSDYSMWRIIQILGKLGNWRRVLQLIEWLQMCDRFKSHKIKYIYTSALSVLSKARRPVEALNLFHLMQQHMSTYPDLAAYHHIAVTLGQAGHMKELFEVIDNMRSPPKKKFKTGILEKWDPRLEPDIVVYNAVLNACVRRKQWEGAFWVLQQFKEQGQQPSSATYGLVMEVMFACGKYNLVHEFFDKALKFSVPNSLTYKVLVNTLWNEGKTDEAVLAVEDMERRGIIGSAALYYDLARCLCSAGRCQEALVQIDKICKVANKPLVVTYTGLIQACLDAGNIQHGAHIFNRMHKFCSPNLVTCNIMLKAYLEHGMFEEAKEQQWDDFEYVYKQMLHYGFHFNAKRHLRMIMDACRAGKVELLETTWKHLIRGGQTLPPLLAKEMICMKLEQGDHSAALSFFSNHHFGESQVFSRNSWLNFFKENAHRLQKDSLVRLVHEGSILSDSQGLVFQNLITSCREFLRTHVTLSEMYSSTNSQLTLLEQL